ncbi:hypothetical protein ACOZB4_19465 [Paenibacillus sp. NPDC058898]
MKNIEAYKDDKTRIEKRITGVLRRNNILKDKRLAEEQNQWTKSKRGEYK